MLEQYSVYIIVGLAIVVLLSFLGALGCIYRTTKKRDELFSQTIKTLNEFVLFTMAAKSSEADKIVGPAILQKMATLNHSVVPDVTTIKIEKELQDEKRPGVTIRHGSK